MMERLYTLIPGSSRILVCDAITGQFIGLLVPQFPGETARSFMEMYGPIFPVQTCTNLDQFPELQESEHFAIEYLSNSETAKLFEQIRRDRPQDFLQAEGDLIRLCDVKLVNSPGTLNNATHTPDASVETQAMVEEKIYLELSEAEGGSHKFYEVVIQDTLVTIRYGRIGDQGQTQSKTYPSADKAKAEATKKINEKLRKGYERAVMGVRQKRSVTRRAIASNRSTAQQAPVVWKFASGAPALGIFIDARACWIGNQDGRIFALDHNGQVLNQFRLPDGVKCIVADDDWLYAGCDDGKVYDLSGKVPRVAYEIAPDVDIFWLDIKDGVLGVSDAEGRVTTINHEDESQWSRQSQGQSGWMVRCDEIGVYHGHSTGVTMYDWEDGSQIWHQKTGSVLFGWQEEATVYAGTSDGKVHCFTKKGEARTVYQCDAAVYSCAAAEDGKYVFAGDNYSSIYCFSESGERLWKLGTGCGSAFSMQFWRDRLYIVTTDGSFACIDASEAAIQAAQAGTVPTVVDIKAPQASAPLPSSALETTSDASQGVIVKCFQEGGKLRVRVVSAGYNSQWKVQFPKDIREAGSRYLVESVRESARGGFYRAYGDIKKLV